MNLLVGFVLLVLGGISIVNPEASWNLRTYIGRKFFDMKYTPSKKTFERFRLLGIIYILIGLFITVAGSNAPKVEPEVIIPAGTTTLTGEVICLPHKDTSGPQTMECAFGLRTQDGLNYALDYGTNYDAIPDNGTTVTVTGHVTPVQALSTDHWQKYDMVGIISVE